MRQHVCATAHAPPTLQPGVIIAVTVSTAEPDGAVELLGELEELEGRGCWPWDDGAGRRAGSGGRSSSSEPAGMPRLPEQ